MVSVRKLTLEVTTEDIGFIAHLAKHIIEFVAGMPIADIQLHIEKTEEVPE